MVQEKVTIISPDPNGQCQAVALEFVKNFFSNHNFSESNVLAVNTLTKTMDFLERLGSHFAIQLPFLSLTSPKLLWMQLRQPHIFGRQSYKSREQMLLDAHIDHCILYCATPKDLYGLSGEAWTHYFVKVYQNGTYWIYDPLGKMLEDAGLGKPAKLENIDNFTARKILIWN